MSNIPPQIRSNFPPESNFPIPRYTLPEITEYDDATPPPTHPDVQRKLFIAQMNPGLVVSLGFLACIIISCSSLAIFQQFFPPMTAPSQTKTTPTTQHSPVTPKAILNACPDYLSNQNDKTPKLSFCSPRYDGIVAGPVNTKVTLIGLNFAVTPEKWIVFKTESSDKQPIDVPTSCDDRKTCITLPTPLQNDASSDGAIPFTIVSWNLSSNILPSITSQQDYAIAAIFKDNKLAPVASSPSFTLTSTKAPCLSIISAVAQECKNNEMLIATPNSQITWTGENWLLGWDKSKQNTVLNIKITISCVKDQKCQTNNFTVTIPAASIKNDGTFTFKDQKNRVKTGTYRIEAINQIPNQISSTSNTTQNKNTVADGSLRIHPDLAQGELRLVVNGSEQQPTTSPTPSTPGQTTTPTPSTTPSE